MKRFGKILAAALIATLGFALVAEDILARGGRGGRGGGRGGGGRGGRGRGGSGGNQSRKEVVKDLEERRAAEEREARIEAARRLGAQSAFDEMQDKILDAEREEAAAKRRQDWRGLANPG
ncbi:MAG: hypothetical protein ABFS86_08460 [Planctomycetota bacterium]